MGSSSSSCASPAGEGRSRLSCEDGPASTCTHTRMLNTRTRAWHTHAHGKHTRTCAWQTHTHAHMANTHICAGSVCVTEPSAWVTPAASRHRRSCVPGSPLNHCHRLAQLRTHPFAPRALMCAWKAHATLTRLCHTCSFSPFRALACQYSFSHSRALAARTASAALSASSHSNKCALCHLSTPL